MIKALKRTGRTQWALYFMLIPGIIITLIYSYGPLAGLSIAFQQFDITKGLFGSKWIGLENFRYIFMLPDFARALFNTLYISIMKMILGLVFPIFISILLNEVRHVRFKRSIQTAVYLPYFVSWVIIAGVMIDMLSPSTGIINHILGWFGIQPIFFLANKTAFPIVMVISDIWKGFGFGTIMYMAALTGIDPAQYEAASMDGASRFRRIIHITIPGIMPIIVLSATLTLGNILNAGFDQVVNLYSPMVYSTGDIIDTLVYRVGIAPINGMIPLYDIAAAIGLFKSLVSFIMVSTAYWMAHKFADYKIF
jgi:putative aldouronate transport system permease protein